MRKVLVVGSVFAIVILIIASFTNVVDARTTKLDEKRISILRQIEDSPFTNLIAYILALRVLIGDSLYFALLYYFGGIISLENR